MVPSKKKHNWHSKVKKIDPRFARTHRSCCSHLSLYWWKANANHADNKPTQNKKKKQVVLYKVTFESQSQQVAILITSSPSSIINFKNCN
eukprot:scaffold4071_cov136-Skeletonema_marinoi.AAC.7